MGDDNITVLAHFIGRGSIVSDGRILPTARYSPLLVPDIQIGSSTEAAFVWFEAIQHMLGTHEHFSPDSCEKALD
jgi:hypothetical protein